MRALPERSSNALTTVPEMGARTKGCRRSHGVSSPVNGGSVIDINRLSVCEIQR